MQRNVTHSVKVFGWIGLSSWYFFMGVSVIRDIPPVHWNGFLILMKRFYNPVYELCGSDETDKISNLNKL
jgi:hypothetical protein